MDVKHSLQILVWLQRLTRLRQSTLLITSIASLYTTNLSNILTIVSWQTKCQNVNLLLPFLTVLCLLTLPQDELGWHLLVCMIPEASYLVFKSFTILFKDWFIDIHLSSCRHSIRTRSIQTGRLWIVIDHWNAPTWWKKELDLQQLPWLLYWHVLRFSPCFWFNLFNFIKRNFLSHKVL